MKLFGSFKYIVVLLLSFSLVLTACDSDDDETESETSVPEEVFEVFNVNNNEFAASANPANAATVAADITEVTITMSGDFPVENYSLLNAEIFGFPVGENCTFIADGFRCNDAYPFIFEGDLDEQQFPLTPNTWHNEIASSLARSDADYEVILIDSVSNNDTVVTIPLTDGLSANKSYILHLFGGKVTYDADSTDEDSSTDQADFKTYLFFSTSN